MRCSKVLLIALGSLPSVLLSDFLRQDLTLLGADEPWFERAFFEQVDDHDVEEYDRADFSEAADDIIRDLLDPFLDTLAFVLQLRHHIM